MEQEKFSNDIDPWVRIEHYLGLHSIPLGGRKILSFFHSFSLTYLPSFTEEERRIFQADRELINFH